MVAYIALLWLVLTAHAATSKQAANGPCPPLRAMSEEQRLLLANCIPFGTHPEGVAKFAPEFVKGRPYDLYGLLSDGTVSTTLLDQPVRLQFNFMGDSLYAMFYQATLPSAQGDSLFDKLITFYERRYGKARVGDGQDAEYFLRFRTWCTSEYEVVVTCSVADSSRQVGWGFQPLAVECARRPKQ